MADYHPLISRAVAGLDDNTGENRRVLYERARGALVKQLRSVDPPLEESDITRERLALEEAIRKVEAEAARDAPAEQAPRPPAEQTPAALRERGLRGLRQSAAEAEGLGGATAEAHRAAKDFFERTPSESAAPGKGASPAARYFAPDEAEAHKAAPHTAELPPVSEPDLMHEAPPPPPRGRGQGLPEGALPPPPPPYDEPEADYARPPRAWGRILAIAVLVLAIAGLAGVGYWQRDTIARLVASFRAAPEKTQQQATSPPAARPKITDRIQESQSKTATAPAAAVAQKVVLYEQDSSDPQGKRYVGSAIWRTETVSPGSGLAPELAIRADVEIPERHMRMTWSLRRNTDKALPASHTIEVQFTLPADFPEGSIGNVPGVWMKENEGPKTRGIPLAGLSVKVTDGYFLIGLSAVQIDRQRNITMLKDRDWLEIPLVYTSGKRAIVAIEKGTPGQRAFAEAFRAWGE